MSLFTDGKLQTCYYQKFQMVFIHRIMLVLSLTWQWWWEKFFAYKKKKFIVIEIRNSNIKKKILPALTEKCLCVFCDKKKRSFCLFQFNILIISRINAKVFFLVCLYTKKKSTWKLAKQNFFIRKQKMCIRKGKTVTHLLPF